MKKLLECNIKSSDNFPQHSDSRVLLRDSTNCSIVIGTLRYSSAANHNSIRIIFFIIMLISSFLSVKI